MTKEFFIHADISDVMQRLHTIFRLFVVIVICVSFMLRGWWVYIFIIPLRALCFRIYIVGDFLSRFQRMCLFKMFYNWKWFIGCNNRCDLEKICFTEMTFECEIQK